MVLLQHETDISLDFFASNRVCKGRFYLPIADILSYTCSLIVLQLWNFQIHVADV